MDHGNIAWMLISCALVMLMTPGLAFFYSGLSPVRNTLNTIKMSFICLAIIPLIWAVFGYSLVYGGSSQWLGNFDYLGLAGLFSAENKSLPIPIPLFMLFQMMFAVVSPAIISGALVGRMKFSSYILFVLFWTILVYIPLAHWVWGVNGWLAQIGAIDFAGGIVVHISAGFSALIAAIILGPRIGLSQQKNRPHNIPFVVLGASMLWFGWFGFNAGSASAANDLAICAAITTMLAASSAVTTWTLLLWARGKRPSAVGASAAAVIGLVAVTPASGFVTPMGAIVIGSITAIIAQFCLDFLNRFEKVDDAADVFVCHGISGVIGSVLTGVFATVTMNSAGKNGLLAGNTMLIVYQLIAVIVAIVISILGTALILFTLKRLINIRSTPEEEIQGVDIIEHGEKAYDHTLSP
ncbi:Ammonia channel precursor [Legionella quinlivanii]|uniref:Ammonium transporter n=1 Tax=Legionella quinlivanii TaxID=45073 RepID=A0A0W0XYS5_9GAMM|nr:ammonium transporter [Legionella quinlivanii]KTD49717.1 Ammonia channel precursor [Legionella quinlivanii]MCW8451921.1 ammonium transporter [Legionella quinlivanii]SEG23242.1 ammonium transporter (TC 1.A.11) [Legionella quinlivanii DSM 21216]STY09882.1 Ammonia transporter [Legionella quinlivanii]